MNKNITHQAEQHKFEVRVGEHVGYLTYEEHPDWLDLTHTIVPKAMGGQGIGSDLVKYALAYARIHHKQVKPSCSFVAAMMDKHPVYQDLMYEQIRDD